MMSTAGMVQAPVKNLSSRSSFRSSVRCTLPKRSAQISRSVTCSAQANESSRPIQGVLAATALAAAISFGSVDAAKADISGLTPCAESKAFAKRQKTEVKTLQKRLKNYEPDSAPALALNATIDRTERRFATYAKQGLLCGPDGLPHLISDPGLAIRYGHAGETLIPTIGFLYIAGYIGYVGRDYIKSVKSDKKPVEKEYIIDVPFAIKLAFQGIGWPFRAIQELRAGTLTEDDSKITVSPR